MIVGWIEGSRLVYAADEPFAGLGRAGLITIITVSIIAIVTFVWIFREMRGRD